MYELSMSIFDDLKESLEEAIEMKIKQEKMMDTNEEILKELVTIRRLLERQEVLGQPSSKETFKRDHKCLACGQHHPSGTPCPHMIIYCKGE